MTRVLVVDDEIDIVNLLVDDLTVDGFDVTSANDGAAALEKIYREKPEVVLLDLMMPVLNGIEVHEKLRKEPTTKNLPVILATGISTPEREKSAAQLGANHWVTKPWDPGTFQEVIKIVLGEKANQKRVKASASRSRKAAQFQINRLIPRSGWRRRF